MKSKQVIVIRKDLNMRKGKMVAQGAHASMKVILDMMTGSGGFKYISSDGRMGEITKYLTFEGGTAINDWINGIFTKICVSVDSEDELIGIYESAKAMELPCSLIEDVGLTEFDGVLTKTAVAIGPAWEDDVNQITGHLKLL
jgi:PTH2 family peptidyl-tRNA hydrolase